jgi:serine/threonine protein phosphatase 1
MRLLKTIEFNEGDTLYLLGDIIDRGENSLKCLEISRLIPNIICLMGNHEKMLVDYFIKNDNEWLKHGGRETIQQVVKKHGKAKAVDYWYQLLQWLQGLPALIEISVSGTLYSLSHAGFNSSQSLDSQTTNDFLENRENFYYCPALKERHWVFGHTPTALLRNSSDCSVWKDPVYADKTNIDCGCVYGGALAALRLDDGKIFYERRQAK